MFGNSNKSQAEIMESFLQNIAIAVFLTALAFAAKAAIHLVPPEIAGYLRPLKTILGIGAVVLILPGYLQFLRRFTRSQRKACVQSEGFVAHAFRKACAKAFELTFVFLVILNFITRDHLQDLPTVFFMQFLTFLTLVVFSIAFFVFSRGDSDLDSLA